MLHFEREVIEPQFIAAILNMIHEVNLGLNDEDGFPYVVPLNFGYEMTEDKLYIYTHFMKRGKKLDLMRRDDRVCCTFAAFNDFPDHPYKKHLHDYRSVIAKGRIRIVDGKEDYETFKKGYNLLYTCNNREIKPLENRPQIPPMYIGEIVCDLKDVTAKSEFPIRCVEDVPFIDVRNVPQDDEPFDISDIIKARKERMKAMKK